MFSGGFFSGIRGVGGLGVMWEDITMKEVFMGEGTLLGRGSPDFPSIF